MAVVGVSGGGCAAGCGAKTLEAGGIIVPFFFNEARASRALACWLVLFSGFGNTVVSYILYLFK